MFHPVQASVEGGAWSPAESMINGRRYHTLTAVGRHLVAAGGYRDAERDAAKTGKWDTVEIFTEGQGRKLLSCSQVKSRVKELTWLLIGCPKTKNQSGAKLSL